LLILQSDEPIFDAKVSLYNAVGKLISVQRWENGQKQQLDISGLTSGVYQIILQEKDQYWVGKVM